MFLFSYQICSILEWYMVNENIWTDMTMSGIQLHSHVPSHTSIYLSMLSFLSNIKKFVLQFPFCIDHFDVILQKIRKRYTSLVFISVYRHLEIVMKINYVKIFVELKINRHTLYIFQPSDLTS